jgi:GH25 family lysozyme M1 (1,4-beta-N-acetylmuramidase)/LysM repeat protein
MEETVATVPGIDVSYWDSGIDWPKVRATGQRFVFIKATEADNYSDPTFDDNWVGAKSAGLLRGAYHFYRCNVDPKKQADHFIEYVKTMNDNGELPPVLDLEINDGVGKDKIVSKVKLWLDRVEAAFGMKPIIYSGQFFLQDFLSETGGGPPAWAKDYPLWLAQYPNQYAPGMQPVLPRGWFKWTIWQYSDKGRVNGINTKADMDLFNGTLEELYKLAGAKMEPAKQTSKVHGVSAGDTFETIANKYGVTVRELAATNPQLLKIGDKLTIPNPAAIPQETGAGSGSTSGGGGTTARKYTVKAGDTLMTIAIKFGVTVPEIASSNDITNLNNISVGQELIIP